jgi:hypothetical protein
MRGFGRALVEKKRIKKKSALSWACEGSNEPFYKVLRVSALVYLLYKATMVQAVGLFYTATDFFRHYIKPLWCFDVWDFLPEGGRIAQQPRRPRRASSAGNKFRKVSALVYLPYNVTVGGNEILFLVPLIHRRHQQQLFQENPKFWKANSESTFSTVPSTVTIYNKCNGALTFQNFVLLPHPTLTLTTAFALRRRDEVLWRRLARWWLRCRAFPALGK